MNGVHDMGGMHGFGSVATGDAAQFHADWERLVFAMDKAVRAQGIVNIDEKRHAIERMPPAAYLQASYFERWLAALETYLAEKGHLEPDAVDAYLASTADPFEVAVRTDPDLATAVRNGFEADAAFDRPAQTPAFDPGQTVRVTNRHPAGHTRCPRYARRATGEINTVHGTFVFPDANAHGTERAEPLYSVGFAADELWGPDAEADTDTVYIDLWEPYLTEP